MITTSFNRVRTGSQTLAKNYPSNAPHIWVENDPVNEHNSKELEKLSKRLFALKATEAYTPNVKNQNINTILSKGRSETGRLDFEVKITEGARVMLTTNINIADRLINGQMETVVRIDVNKVTKKINCNLYKI